LDVVTDLAVREGGDRGLVEGEGKDLDIPADEGGEEALEGTLGEGVVLGKGGFEDIVPGDVDDIVVRGETKGGIAYDNKFLSI
jgi:hypothetical protein